MYPSSVNAPRLYAMIFGFFSLTAIFVVAQASLKLTNDADKTIYLAQAAEEMAPLTNSTLGAGSGDTTTTAPTLAPLPTFTSSPSTESNQPNEQFNSQPNSQSNTQGQTAPVREQFNKQQNNKQDNFRPANNFNNQGLNQPNEMMGPEGEQMDQEEQRQDYDIEAITSGIRDAQNGFKEFTDKFSGVGSFIKEWKATSRIISGTPLKKADTVCDKISNLLSKAKSLQADLSGASSKVVDGFKTIAEALDVASHVMALDGPDDGSVDGEQFALDTGDDEESVAKCQGATDLKRTGQTFRQSINQISTYTKFAVRKINAVKGTFAKMNKQVAKLNEQNDPSKFMRLFGQAEKDAQELMLITNQFLSRIIPPLDDLSQK